MVKLSFAVFLTASVAWRTAAGLQVTPNSECASVCMDDPTQDKSDPNVSNTEGSDIVCRDENYSSPEGQKFKNCITCLSNSTASSDTESDLQWFLYNLRFAFNTCLFGLANATDPLSSPCSIKQSCGTLVGPLQDGMDNPSGSNRYSYCTAFNGLFLGSRIDPCQKCLTLTSEQHYTANFLVALRAGCSQQPEVGTHIGLDGTLFSKTIVNETSPVEAPPPTGNHNGGLSLGAYIGIGVAGLAVLLIFGASIFIGMRKRAARKEREMFSSDYDGRFGNKGVTGPVPGAYNDPHPPKPTAYQSVGEVRVSPKFQSSPRGRSQSRTDSDYNYNQHDQRPLSQHIEMSRGVGIAAPYNPSISGRSTPAYSPPAFTQRGEAPAYSPPGFTQRGETPTSHNSSPSSIAHSRTNLVDSPSSFETSNQTRTKAAPIIGTGLPKAPPPLPARSDSTATATSTYTARPARHTRDLSVGRGEDGGSNSNSQISGPIITVNTRFDEDEEARKRKERERLYRQGFKKGANKERGSPDNEHWPGNY